MGAFMKVFSEANYNYLEQVFGPTENDYLGCLLRKGQIPQLGSGTRIDGACPVPTFDFSADGIPNTPIPPSAIPPPPLIPPDPIIPPLADIPPRSRIPPPAKAPPPGSGASSGLAKGGSGGNGGIGGSSGVRSGGPKNLIPTTGGSSGKAFGDLQASNQRNTAGGKGNIIRLSKSEDEGGTPLAGESAFGDDSRNIGSNIRGSRVVQLSKKAKNQLTSQKKDSTINQGAGNSSRKRVIPLVESNKVFVSTKDEGWSWDFGALIKYLIIIAVILLILLLIGGQFLQIKKGLEGSR